MATTRIAIVGSGLIGCAWAVSFARGGCDVAMYDATPGVAEAAPARIREMAEEMHGVDMLLGATPEDVTGRIRVATDLADALDGVAHVQENVPERLEIKLPVWAELDALAPADAVLASSTSALLPSKFTEELKGRHRCVVAHPINPPSLIPAVEVVPAPWTDAQVVERTATLMERIGQTPIRMQREVDGFLMNRLQGALLQEAFRLVEQGIASPEDVDIGIREGLAPRWALMGPFETIDLNAPGGVRDYVTRYAGIYETMAPSQRDPADWTGPALERVEADRRAALPLDEIPQAQARRDSRLMALMQFLRGKARQ
ncbi:3-hydroxyacyl-CoA dehydrogenase [Pseudoponticoccus marisrubri]|uniref:3-hydroxyacyl-CoA dehydrogenase n=1 Tax=Pseudoponticoccus marisrubri TaxID=1685382 RepID=A0A0W7WHE5_9RHOB|nr:3-hydroxyacyl-CoA dehydrogenase [Pseudoponticoccus marisrubri]KUF09974.1 3-hydroxyacyl-CoA dehydrogenase [Pseudoponticoccus marisrubri]